MGWGNQKIIAQKKLHLQYREKNHNEIILANLSALVLGNVINFFFFFPQKPSAAPSKPAGTKAAAKSRLAAAKAAMKAKQQAAEAEKAAKDAGNNDDNLMLKLQEGAKAAETVVFDGGFFQVESPAKPPGEQTS